jgi:prevent-host-death family protein
MELSMAMNPGPAPKKPRRRQLAALRGYRDWQLHDAKAHLSDLVRRAREEGPQRITVYGQDAVVVVSAAEFAEMMTRSRPRRSLHALLSDSPLRDLEFGEDGERSPVRDIGL